MTEIPALEMHDVHRSYGSLAALRGVSFAVPEGEVFGLLGPNGAGKTTAIRLLTGQLHPHRGQVRVLGVDPAASSRDLSKRIGVMLEEAGHYERLPLRSNLTFFARLYGAGPERVQELLELVGLQDKSGEPVARLSRGMRQRLALARALVGSPRVLFLDEPTAGLDPHAARGVRRLIEDFCARQGTVFLTTHFMEEAEELCHQVGILDRGRLVALGNPQDLCRESLPELVETIRGGRRVQHPPGLEELFIHLTGRSLD